MRNQRLMGVRHIFFILMVIGAISAPLAAETSKAVRSTLPLVFEPNLGQADPSVRFLSRGSGYGLFLTEREAVLSLVHPTPTVVRMKVVGQSSRPQIDGLEAQAGASHYFRGA